MTNDPKVEEAVIDGLIKPHRPRWVRNQEIWKCVSCGDISQTEEFEEWRGKYSALGKFSYEQATCTKIMGRRTNEW